VLVTRQPWHNVHLNERAAKAILLDQRGVEKQIPISHRTRSGHVRQTIVTGPGGVMKGARMIKSGLTRIAVWCALVGVTVLLTVLFSFLGNLTVAVVSGLVLGSARRWRWNALPISLVFPAVILGISHFFKSELPPEKVRLIALVCGAAFWGVYAMAFSLHILEQKAEVPSAMETGKADLPDDSGRTETAALRGFNLAALRGIWICDDAAADGSTQHKTLRIEDGSFALSVSEPDGRLHEIARGAVNVGQSKAGESVVTLEELQPVHAVKVDP
jgi:hypothetical protein